MNFLHVETVNFYGDNIEVALTDTGMAFVSVSQITGYLGLDAEELIERFENDPRVQLENYSGETILPLNKLNGFLMLIRLEDVEPELQDDLLKYQVECFDALHDYWIHGVALNRREKPYDINSKFKDERAISRKQLTAAVGKYCDTTGQDPHDLFDKVMGASYKIIGLEPLHEFEKLSGAEAKYLAWVESVFAKTIEKFVVWGETHEDVIAEAATHVEKHLRETGHAWIAMADAVPATLYH